MLEQLLRDSNTPYASIAQVYRSETAGEESTVVRAAGGVDSVYLV
jgi:hypothetical protein